jgi:sugar phosphate isomerase/epimerase
MTWSERRGRTGLRSRSLRPTCKAKLVAVNPVYNVAFDAFAAHRPGRFRSLGDGDVDLGAIFSSLSVYGYDSWAVLEWECPIKNREDGAREGAQFIQKP